MRYPKNRLQRLISVACLFLVQISIDKNKITKHGEGMSVGQMPINPDNVY